MAGAAITVARASFYFREETAASLERRWNDWVDRDATVRTRKDQSQDSAGVAFELLRSKFLLRPAHTEFVVLAELHLHNVAPDGSLNFKPFVPWAPLPTIVGARFIDGDPDTIWLIPRNLTEEDFRG